MLTCTHLYKLGSSSCLYNYCLCNANNRGHIINFTQVPTFDYYWTIDYSYHDSVCVCVCVLYYIIKYIAGMPNPWHACPVEREKILRALEKLK